MLNQLKALWAKVPASTKVEAWHVGRVFAIAFIGTAKDGAPAVLGTPSFAAWKALLVAATLAGFAAAYPLAKAGAKASLAKLRA